MPVMQPAVHFLHLLRRYGNTLHTSCRKITIILNLTILELNLFINRNARLRPDKTQITKLPPLCHANHFSELPKAIQHST